jgi:hypothetical protein
MIMKKAFRCLGLVAILGASVWASYPGVASASVSCSSFNFHTCAPFQEGSRVICTRADGSNGLCVCSGGFFFCN